MREQRSDQVWLVKKREVKARDNVVNLAQDDHACSGKLLRVLRVLRWVAQDAQERGKLIHDTWVLRPIPLWQRFHFSLRRWLVFSSVQCLLDPPIFLNGAHVRARGGCGIKTNPIFRVPYLTAVSCFSDLSWTIFSRKLKGWRPACGTLNMAARKKWTIDICCFSCGY